MDKRENTSRSKIRQEKLNRIVYLLLNILPILLFVLGMLIFNKRLLISLILNSVFDYSMVVILLFSMIALIKYSHDKFKLDKTLYDEQIQAELDNLKQ